MKNYTLLALLTIISLSLISCEAVNTVFEAGKIWGILIAVVVIGLFLFLFRGRGK